MVKFLLPLVASVLPLVASVSPAVAEETIQIGAFTFGDPLMIAVNYAQSQSNSVLFALGITHSNQAMTAIGLTESTAIHVNCKTGEFTAAFGYKTADGNVTGLAISQAFCDFHKKTFSHSLW